MIITVHRVTFDKDGKEEVRGFCVLWVVCHRNFDFIGKLFRKYGHPLWRERTKGGPRVIEDAEIDERMYALWVEILLAEAQKQRLPGLWRSRERRMTNDPMDYLFCNDHPE
eukprot:1315567-Rhodomonas_salina.1